MFDSHKAIVPGFIGITGNVFFVLGIPQDKTEFMGMLSQKRTNGSILKISRQSAFQSRNIERKPRLVFGVSRFCQIKTV